jgi:hypothetical protein
VAKCALFFGRHFGTAILVERNKNVTIPIGAVYGFRHVELERLSFGVEQLIDLPWAFVLTVVDPKIASTASLRAWPNPQAGNFPGLCRVTSPTEITERAKERYMSMYQTSLEDLLDLDSWEGGLWQIS